MAKDKFQKKVKKWRGEAKKERAKRETISVVREKKKAKPIDRTGKCPPGKRLSRGKCVPRIEYKKPGKKMRTKIVHRKNGKVIKFKKKK